MSSPEAQRVETLLRQLTTRAAHCPGITPLRESEDFLALACWQAGTCEEAAVSKALELLWRHPEEAFLWINRLLLESGTASGPALFDPRAPAPCWKTALQAARVRAA